MIKYKEVKMTKVTVYSTPFCPWCIKTKEFLKKNKISFKDIDVSSNPKAAKKMVELSGQNGVPVIDIDGEIVVGFNEEKLKELLKL